MKKKIEIILFLALFALVIVPFAHAWKWETHQYLAEKVCNGDLASVDKGAIAPDNEFKDFINHHVYRQCNSALNAEWCDGSGCFDCSKGNIADDIAISKADEWILKMKATESLIDKSYDCGVASHYFFDSKVYFHQTKSEKDSCHSQFEAKVNERIKAKDYSDWTECECGACVSYSDFLPWIEEFTQMQNSTTISSVITGQGGGGFKSDEVAPMFWDIQKFFKFNWARLWQWIG